jgi:predicted secreted Zn-dependent protease
VKKNPYDSIVRVYDDNVEFNIVLDIETATTLLAACDKDNMDLSSLVASAVSDEIHRREKNQNQYDPEVDRFHPQRSIFRKVEKKLQRLRKQQDNYCNYSDYSEG